MTEGVDPRTLTLKVVLGPYQFNKQLRFFAAELPLIAVNLSSLLM